MDNRYLRGVNALDRVIVLIRETPNVTRAEIALQLGLSRPAVSQAVRQLLDVGLVHELAPEKRLAKGRRRIPLLLNYDAFHVLAVDVGGTTVRGAVLNLRGDILYKQSEQTDPNGLVDQLLCLAASLSERSTEPLLGLGIGVAATIDPVSEEILLAPALDLVRFDLKARLTEQISLPICLANDVNVATLGEAWRGACAGHANAVCISVGTGIGAGLLLDGHLHSGAHGLAGEVGYLYRGDKLPNLPYEQFGALEEVASGYGIARRLTAHLEKGIPAKAWSVRRKGRGVIDAKAVLEAADAGDPLANSIVDQAAFEIGLATSNIANVLDPEVVVLIGGIMHYKDRILPIVEKVLNHICAPDIRRQIKVCAGQLGDDPVLIGACYLVQDRLLARRVSANKSARAREAT